MAEHRRTDSGTVGLNAKLAFAIQDIANSGKINPRTNAPYRGVFVSGYVAKIHDDPKDEENFGKIDVQDWESATESTVDNPQGYYSGVLLNAIQQLNQGMVLVPKLYSDVVIMEDPRTAQYYVTMFSHVDTIKLDAHEKLTVGVAEREKFVLEDNEGPDVDELALTGKSAVMEFENDSATITVENKDKSKLSKTYISADRIYYDIGEGKSSYDATENDAEIKVGQEKIKVDKNGVYIGADSNTSHAVLGEELADILSEILSSISQIQVTTSLGPQPCINVGKFVALNAKIKAWKSSLSKFISKKVNIQK